MRTNIFSATVLMSFVSVFALSSCKERELSSDYLGASLSLTEPIDVCLVSDMENDTKPKAPALNKLALKYGVKTKVYKSDDVDRVPLFDATCLQSKNPVSCSSDKLSDFITDNIKYPRSEVHEGNEAYEIIQFVVDKNGRVANTKIVSTVNNDCKSCKQVAIDAFNKMGTWLPAKKNGVNVAVELSVPIKFEIRTS